MANPLYDSLIGKYAKDSTPFLHLLNGETINHDTFVNMSGRYANAICKMGLSPGDRVAVQVKKSPESLAVYAACVQAGLIYLPLNTAYTANEVSYFIENSQAKLFICEVCKEHELIKIAEREGAILETINSEGEGTFVDKTMKESDSFKTVDRDGEDLVALLYTSGTTGKPKGAMLTQNNLLSNSKTLVDIWKFTDKDMLLHALPIYHTHGLFVAINVSLMAGGTIIFLPDFNLDSVIKNISNANVMMGVPTFYTRLLGDSRFNENLTKHFRLFVSGSAPLLTETHVQFEARTGHRILERYGMTETNMNTSNPYEGERRAGTVGFRLPEVELRITDTKTGNVLTNGEVGGIEVRGPNVFKGYWRMPEKTAKELRNDGFFVTGDLGKIDDDGYLHITGRNKDLIISGGFNIYPKEIELILDCQPGISESAVIGIPQSDLSEVVIGVIVPKNNSHLNLLKIEKTIKRSLAKFKHPRKLVLIDELPRNSMGKVQKNLLREVYKDILKLG